MSEEIKIHHESMIGTHFEGQTSRTTVAWTKVTCGDCRLEEPFVPEREHELSPEVVRQHSLAAQKAAAAPGEFIATLEHVAMWQKRLAKLQALEEAALDLAAHWARTVTELTKVREATEKALRLAQSGRESSGAAAVGSAGTEPQGAAQGATGAPVYFATGRRGSGDLAAARLNAPVNSVDIRTDVREDEGMTNTKSQLSEDAKSALMSAKSSTQGAKVIECKAGALRELNAARLIGAVGGLTPAGAIERARLVAEAEEAAFGPLG